MLKKRILLIMMLLLFVIIVGIFIWVGTDNSGNNKQIYNSSTNIAPVYNQGKEILEYNSNIYFVNNYSNSIVKYNKENNSSTVLVNSKNNSTYGENLFIMSNKLIYTCNGKTYTLDLDTYENKEILNGELVYINEDICLYLMNSSSLQNLFLSSYDKRTLNTTSTISYNLATGYIINYIGLDNDVLLFSSQNSDKTASLFYVDVKNYKMKFVAKEELLNTTYRTKITDAIFNGDNKIYYINKNYEYSHTTEEETLINTYVNIADLNYGYSIPKIEIVLDDLVKYGEKDPKIVYSVYKSEDDETESDGTNLNDYDIDAYIEWTDGKDGTSYDKKDVARYAYDDITDFIDTKENSVYFLDNKLMDCDPDYSVEKVLRYGDNIYVLLLNGSWGELYSCKVDGTELIKIYEWR